MRAYSSFGFWCLLSTILMSFETCPQLSCPQLSPRGVECVADAEIT